MDRPRQLPDLEVHTGGGGDPHPGQPQGLRLPLQGQCECAQARRQLAWPAAAGVPRAQLDTRLASLSCTLRGSVPPRASSAPPRETPEFVGNVVVCWREIPARLPSPLSPRTPCRPQPGGGGASTGGQAAASPPPSSPIGAKLGEGATPGNRQPTNPTRASCLSFPTGSTPSALAAPGPAQRFRLSRSSNSPWPRWRGLGLGRGARPGQWQRLRRGDSPEPRTSPPAARVPLPRSGPRASSLLI